LSNKAETIERLRNILKRAKDEMYDQNGKLNISLHSDVSEALCEIKDNNLTILAKEIYALLDSPSIGVKRDAIATLGFTTRLHVPEFRDKAYEIFLNDPDDSVKSTSIRAWVSYYYESDDEKVLKKLYKILIDENQSCFVRSAAYMGIHTTIKDLFNSRTSLDTDPLISSETPEEFNKQINWPWLEDVMRQYAPEALRGDK
jgi:hypothetical protein